MKWIGQHIWDFISRFRSDVYLEGTDSGTIAGGGNLGLDTSGKIVKAAIAGDGLTLTNAGDNRVATSTGGTGLNSESNLEFHGTASIMKIGADDNTTGTIMRQLHTSDDGGNFLIQAGAPTLVPSSSNKSGGDLVLQPGFHTGSGTAGSVILKTSKGAGGSGTGVVLQTPTVSIKETNVHLEEDVTISFEGGSDNGYETTLTVADPSADRTITLPNATGTVALTSNLEAGWHGSTTRIKILHSDFIADDGGRPLMIDDTGVASEELFGETYSTSPAYATVAIPTGYQATELMIYGSGTGAVEVWEHQINSKTGVSKGTGNVGTAITASTSPAFTAVTSSTTNYLLIQVAAGSDEIHGGYVTIAAV